MGPPQTKSGHIGRCPAYLFLTLSHTRAAEVIDHIIPLAHGGTDADDNCQALCVECHDAKTRSDMGYREKPVIGIDGWPVEGTGAG